MKRAILIIGIISWAIAGPARGALAVPAPAGQFTASQRAALRSRVTADRIQADTDGNRLFDNIEARLYRVHAHETVPVIVRFKRGQEGVSARIRDRIARRLTLDHSVAARLTRAQIRALVASGAVESIEEDTLCHEARDTSQASFGVTKARPDFGLTGDGDGSPNRYTTRDHTIAVIDSGIDGNHPDFAGGKILAWRDFVNGRATPYDDRGHGTHCASIAAGRLVNGVGGVAPDAALIGLKVLDAQGSGSTSNITAAVEWCIQNRRRYGIEVISLSLGGSTSSSGTDALCRMVDRAAADGMVVCVAAGNEGPDSYTISSPAAAETAITVGNIIDLGKNGFALRTTSSRGPTADDRIKPDICGPGYDILAAQANSTGYVRQSGTSMACPFVAGMAALMREADPSLTPDEVKQIIKLTAVHFGPRGSNSEFGAGRLDGYAALAIAYGATGTPPRVPVHLYADGSLSAKGYYQLWSVPVSDLQFPLAISEIMLSVSTSTDFELYLYDPTGQLVAKSESDARQETILFTPTKRGEYTIEVYSYSGSGTYALDVSAGAG